jgi:7-cyano-7-deazaguanine reductase
MKKSTIRRNSVSEIRALDKSLPFLDASAIESHVLETFPYEFAGEHLVIRIDTDEFTAVCPWSGLPDFATIRVEYLPHKSCIELRSFKYYLLSFRNVGIYQEHATRRILNDLVVSCRPRWMQVTADYRIRGGVHTETTAVYGRK